MNEKALRKTQEKAKSRTAKRLSRLQRKHWRTADIAFRHWKRDLTHQNGGGDGFDIA